MNEIETMSPEERESFWSTQPIWRDATDERQYYAGEDYGPDWRAVVKGYDQLEKGDMQFLIAGMFPYGVNLIGGLSAVGKTWFGLSMAKALISGKRFLGNFDVPEPVPVIYLIPESGERTFRKRLELMHMTTAGESFLCRTMHDGFILGLQSKELLEMARVVSATAYRSLDNGCDMMGTCRNQPRNNCEAKLRSYAKRRSI
jgi:hypothetical protein